MNLTMEVFILANGHWTGSDTAEVFNIGKMVASMKVSGKMI